MAVWIWSFLTGIQCAYCSATVTVLLQAATCTPIPVYAFGSLALADFDGDGKLDVASGAGDFLLLGNGDGTFQDPLVLGAGGSGIAVGDFNGDGRPDLATGGVIVLLNSTSGVRSATTTVVMSSSNPSSFGQLVRFTATVSASGRGTPTGSVTFRDGTTDLTTTPIYGEVATFSTSSLTAGSHAITACYDGDSNFAPSSSTPLTQVVNAQPVTVALSSSVNPSVYNQPVSFTATITPQYGGVAMGTVVFYDGANFLGTVSVSGNVASLSGVLLAGGLHTVTAAYSGSDNMQGAISGPLTQTVSQATTATSLSSSATPVAPNQPVTYTATVTSQYGGVTTGTVSFQDNTSTTVVPVTGGLATLNTTYVNVRKHLVTATYSGDGNNATSTSPTLTEWVANLPVASRTVITTSGSPTLIGQTVVFTATIASTYGQIPDGEMVSFFDGSTLIGSGVTANGVATLSTSSLTAKTHTVKATYAGDGTFNSSSGTVTQIVALYDSTTTITSTLNPSAFGQSVTLTATVNSGEPGAPTGSVIFKNGSTAVGTGTLSNGIASVVIPDLPAGALSLTAVYGGDAASAGSISSVLMQTVNQATTTTTVSSSLNPSNKGQKVTFTAIVSSPTTLPTGKVTFMAGSVKLGTVTLSGGQATVTTSTLPSGQTTVTATYGGTANVDGSAGSVVQDVQ